MAKGKKAKVKKSVCSPTQKRQIQAICRRIQKDPDFFKELMRRLKEDPIVD